MSEPTPDDMEIYEEVTADVSAVMTRLTSLLLHAEGKYRRGEYTGMSDHEFDRAMKALETLEEGWPMLKDPKSPTDKVGHEDMDKEDEG